MFQGEPGDPGRPGRPGDQGEVGAPGRYDPNLDQITKGPQGIQGPEGKSIIIKTDIIKS